ncbi:MAG: cobalt ECF transporter T component CbiQ [Thermoguttaceae bacterium]|jgi:cobalt/nickel transport system permease protein
MIPHAVHADGSWLARVDPRVRILAAAVLSVVAAAAQRMPTMGVALAAAVLAVGWAGLPAGAVLRRLLPMEIILLLLVLVLPWTARGEPLVSAGWPAPSREGLLLAAVIIVKAHAIVLGVLALVGTMDGTVLGHALAHFHVPRKLVHLLLFTVRYLDVLEREYRRLRAAMKVRSFRPRMDGHTYRAYGYLVGMLLVRSFDRSERVLAAMKCRGFRGRFYLLDHFVFCGRRDLPFCAAAAALLAILFWLEWA